MLGHDMDWKKNRLELKNEEAGYGAAIELLLSHRPSPLFASCCSRLFSSGCEGERGGGLIEDSNLHHNGALVISHLLKDNAKRLLHAQPACAFWQDVLALCLALMHVDSQSITDLHHVG